MVWDARFMILSSDVSSAGFCHWGLLISEATVATSWRDFRILFPIFFRSVPLDCTSLTSVSFHPLCVLFICLFVSSVSDAAFNLSLDRSSFLRTHASPTQFRSELMSSFLSIWTVFPETNQTNKTALVSLQSATSCFQVATSRSTPCDAATWASIVVLWRTPSAERRDRRLEPSDSKLQVSSTFTFLL